jgi:hypothetical protein
LGSDETGAGDKHFLERHIQTVAISVSLALLFWGASTLVDIRDRISRFEERLASITAQVQQGTDDRFRGSDWRREKERLDERHNQLQLRLERLEDAMQQQRFKSAVR